jgi:hypothetical protein
MLPHMVELRYKPHFKVGSDLYLYGDKMTVWGHLGVLVLQLVLFSLPCCVLAPITPFALSLPYHILTQCRHQPSILLTRHS